MIIRYVLNLILFFKFGYDPCIEFHDESNVKINNFYKTVERLENPFYLSKKELFSIVSPEYVTYNSAKNELEIIIIKSNLYLNTKKFDLSFGPFQMKISFIRKILLNSPFKIINDPVLINIKKNLNHLTPFQIDYLNRIETQWRLLRLFEYSNLDYFKKYSINALYTIYNRGKLNKNKTIFNKIVCKELTYEEWCSYFLNLSKL